MLKLCVRCSNCCDMSNILMMARKSIYFWINEYICAVYIGVMYNIIVYNREYCIFRKKNRWMIKIKLHFIMIMMRKCRRETKCGVKWETKINKGTQPLINSTCTAFLFVAIVDSGLVMNAVSSIYCDYPAKKERKILLAGIFRCMPPRMPAFHRHRRTSW